MTETLNKAREEQIVAGIVYFSSIIPMFGMIVPFITWIVSREKSSFLVFHALQALLFQVIGTAVYIFLFVLYFLSFFVVFIAGAVTAITSGNNEPGPIFFIFFCIPFVIFFLIFVSFFLFGIYAITAGISIIINGDFKVILLGKALEKYLLKDLSTSENNPSHER